MSQESAEQITRDDVEAIIAAFNARDFAAIEALPAWNPEAEFHAALATADGEVYRGIEGLRRWAEVTEEIWADFRTTVIDFREASEQRFVVVFHTTGHARQSGVPLDTQTAQVWAFRDGKLWRNVSYTDPRDAFAAVGLSE